MQGCSTLQQTPTDILSSGDFEITNWGIYNSITEDSRTTYHDSDVEAAGYIIAAKSVTVNTPTDSVKMGLDVTFGIEFQMKNCENDVIPDLKMLTLHPPIKYGEKFFTNSGASTSNRTCNSGLFNDAILFFFVLKIIVTRFQIFPKICPLTIFSLLHIVISHSKRKGMYSKI